MSNYFYITLFSLCFISINAQNKLPIKDGKVTYSSVVQVDSTISKSQIFNAAKQFIASNKDNFNRGNSEKQYSKSSVIWGLEKADLTEIDSYHRTKSPLAYEDKEESNLIGKVSYKYTGSNLRCLRTIYVNFDLHLKFKKGRYKYTLTDFTYTHYNHFTKKQMQFAGIKDRGPCSSKGNLESLINCDGCRKSLPIFYSFLDDDVYQFTEKMKNEILKNVISINKEEDW